MMRQPATVGTTDEELDAILAANLLDISPPDPAITSVEYIRSFDLILLKLDDRRRLSIPREQLQGLEEATPEQLASIEIIGTQIIGWPELDVHHYLPNLIAGRYASEKWKKSREQHAVAA